MLRSLRALEHYVVSARSGDLGRVRDFLIDDEHWRVRHLVLPSGHLLAGRGRLLSPRAIERADWTKRRLYVALGEDEIKNCPNIDRDPPVSVQHERGGPYEDEPYYWSFLGLWAQGPCPGLLAARKDLAHPVTPHASDPHLRSWKELQSYAAIREGEQLGHVDDFMVDDETWRVRYLVIEARTAVFSEKLLLATEEIRRVSWTQKTVFVDGLIAPGRAPVVARSKGNDAPTKRVYAEVRSSP